MTNIQFERVQRDCPWNETHAREPRKLINDFRVLVDGVHRAWMRRSSTTGKGYYFLDPDLRPLLAKYQLVDAQWVFRRTVEEALAAGIIPTVEQVAELRAADKAKADAEQAEKDRRSRCYAAQQAAPELWHAVEDLLRAPGVADHLYPGVAPPHTRLGEIHDLVERHRQGVAEIEAARAEKRLV